MLAVINAGRCCRTVTLAAAIAVRAPIYDAPRHFSTKMPGTLGGPFFTLRCHAFAADGAITVYISFMYPIEVRRRYPR